jgi:hypothetical protein
MGEYDVVESGHTGTAAADPLSRGLRLQAILNLEEAGQIAAQHGALLPQQLDKNVLSHSLSLVMSHCAIYTPCKQGQGLSFRVRAKNAVGMGFSEALGEAILEKCHNSIL